MLNVSFNALNQVGFKDRNFIAVGFVRFSIKTNVGLVQIIILRWDSIFFA